MMKSTMKVRTRLWLAAAAFLVVLLALIFVDAIAVAFDDMNRADSEASQRDAADRDLREKRCMDLGGVPIRSGWTNDLSRCDFPPKVSK
jgi:hypothetical protein